MSLSKAEEEVMGHIWHLKSAYLKDIIECYPDPKPASTTIATLLKRIHEKGFLKFRQEGKSRRYSPLISKNQYFGNKIKNIISDFFNGSNTQFASFFTDESDLTDEELADLKQMIEKQIKSRK